MRSNQREVALRDDGECAGLKGNCKDIGCGRMQARLRVALDVSAWLRLLSAAEKISGTAKKKQSLE